MSHSLKPILHHRHLMMCCYHLSSGGMSCNFIATISASQSAARRRRDSTTKLFQTATCSLLYHASSPLPQLLFPPALKGCFAILPTGTFIARSILHSSHGLAAQLPSLRPNRASHLLSCLVVTERLLRCSPVRLATLQFSVCSTLHEERRHSNVNHGATLPFPPHFARDNGRLRMKSNLRTAIRTGREQVESGVRRSGGEDEGWGVWQQRRQVGKAKERKKDEGKGEHSKGRKRDGRRFTRLL